MIKIELKKISEAFNDREEGIAEEREVLQKELCEYQ